MRWFGCVDGWMDGLRMDGWMDGLRMDGLRMDGLRMDGWMDGWTVGWMVACVGTMIFRLVRSCDIMPIYPSRSSCPMLGWMIGRTTRMPWHAGVHFACAFSLVPVCACAGEGALSQGRRSSSWLLPACLRAQPSGSSPPPAATTSPAPPAPPPINTNTKHNQHRQQHQHQRRRPSSRGSPPATGQHTWLHNV